MGLAFAMSYSPRCFSSSSQKIPYLSLQFQTQIGLQFRPGHILGINNPLSRLQLQCIQKNTTAAVVRSESWDKMVLRSDVPVLVEFYASWCGPCRMVHRVIDEIATEYSGRLKFFLLDTDNDLQVAEDYDIKDVPVVLLFKNGEQRESVIGTMPKDVYVAAIDRVLAS